MDMIEKARELGKAIQEDERYIKMQSAKEACDNDTALQEAIGAFNLKRLAINNETQKEDKDEAKIKELNEEFGKIYADILRNENMTAYNEAKQVLDALVQRVTGIVTLCADGVDPETADYDPTACGGDCSGCSGCS